MGKLRTFQYAFKRSLTDFRYYKEVLRVSPWFSLKYLIVLIFASIFIQTLIFSVQAAFLLPQLPETLTRVQERVEEAYPDDLVIRIQEGTLSINQETPYHIDIPELNDIEGYDHLITIDPQAEVSDFLDARSIVLVTDKEIIYPDQQEGSVITSYRVMSLREFPENVTIDEQQYKTFVDKLDPIFEWIPRLAPFLLIVGIFLIPIFGTVFSLLWQLFYLVILAGIVYLISKVFHLQVPYSKIYQLGMHGMTIPIVLTFLMTMLGVYIPLVFTSSFLLWMVLVLSKLERDKR